jgi:hypothetical protein
MVLNTSEIDAAIEVRRKEIEALDAWRVDRLEDALKLAKATGISLEKLAGPKLDLSHAEKLKADVHAARSGRHAVVAIRQKRGAVE